jgi:hypothetical protein
MSKYIDKSQKLKQRFKNLLTGKWAYRLEEIQGLSLDSIESIEQKYNIDLPQSYRVFLSEFGNTSKFFLLDLDMGDEHPLEMTEFFYGALTTPDSGYVPPTNIPQNMFVFGSYLYEHFYFFFLDDPSDDPVVYLANLSQGNLANLSEGKAKPFQFEKIGESVWEFLEESIEEYEIGKKEGRYFVDN